MTDLAAEQLADLTDNSAGAIQVLGSRPLRDGTLFTISLDTMGIQTVPDGIPVRGRERFEVVVGPSFPFRPPAVQVTHRRWARCPHVQWGRQLCLYAVPAVEWNPADGMRGLVSRLCLWLERAAAGELDPAEQPLHPPVAYASYEHGWMVVRPDLGDRVPWRRTDSSQDPDNETRVGTMFAWCTRVGARVDVLEWLSLAELIDRVLAPPAAGAGDTIAETAFVAPLVLISETLDMEYPDHAASLSRSLDAYGYPPDRLLHAVVVAHTVNKRIAARQGREVDAPAIVLLATPARRVDPGRPLAHLAAWHLDDLGSTITKLLGDVAADATELSAKVRRLAHDWLRLGDIDWMVIHEARPEVTRRRDSGSASSWLRGKKVVVLGCGALGAPIAEQCARAEVAHLHLIDHGVVTPGILVRQPYADAEIGLSKARQLADRLARFHTPGTTDVTAAHANVLTGTLAEPDRLLGYDLIIDATADASVRACLETARSARRDRWPATVAALSGHTTDRGLVVVSLPGASGGPHDVLRRTAITVASHAPTGWAAIADDMFPDPPRTGWFFPEPGCSAPTFTGSATQATALASALFWAALRALASPTTAPMSGYAVELATPTSPSPAATARPLRWPNDHVLPENAGDFEVRLSHRALGEMRTEARRGARVRGPRVETGGMLLGALDEATRTIHVDTATGPPPDSRLSAMYYLHGVAGTQELIDTSRTATAGRIVFVGIWHTHPCGPAGPSAIDEAGMSQVVAPDGTGRRALMLILGGPAPVWTPWLDDGTPPHIYARLVRRDGTLTPTGPGPSVVALPDNRWFNGGYSYPPSGAEPADAAPEHSTDAEDPDPSDVHIGIDRVTGPRIGVALSGGGFRATAFGLGCLRALHDLDLLDHVTVVSGISGGSILSAMWAYGPADFDEFDDAVVSLLRDGLQLELARRVLTPPALVMTTIGALTAALLPGKARSHTRTDALVAALSAREFGRKHITEITHPRLRSVISATDLGSGNAVRFSNTASTCSPYGKILDIVTVAEAVAASAAYPLAFPAVQRTYEFERRDGSRHTMPVTMTDGGVYDNLGLAPLFPGRSTQHTAHAYQLDYLICSDAGRGRSTRTAARFLPKRIAQSFDITYRKTQDASRNRLHESRHSGQVAGVVHAYLGMRDDMMPVPVADLIPADAVTRYPTNLRQMALPQLTDITTRAEQLTRVLLDWYCPELHQ